MDCSQILRFATMFMKLAAAEKRILYHIGRRPASPKPFRHSGESSGLGTEEGWERRWINDPVQSGVFLTPHPLVIAVMHGVMGHVYAYSVPQWVIEEAGGVKRFDRGSEVLISEALWNKADQEIEFLGKVMDETKFRKKTWQEFKSGYSFKEYHEYEPSEESKARSFAREWSHLQQSSRPLEVLEIMGKEFKQRMLDSVNAYIKEKQEAPWTLDENALAFKQLLETEDAPID
jgi:hypothetical protein